MRPRRSCGRPSRSAWPARIRTAERELLEQTLRGSVNALSEALAMASPAAFGRSRRIAPVALQVATAAALADWWEVEVAASLADLEQRRPHAQRHGGAAL